MHIRVHTGEEPFICPYCGKGHKQKGQLKVHITKHHPQVQNAFEALSLRRESGSSGKTLDVLSIAGNRHFKIVNG